MKFGSFSVLALATVLAGCSASPADHVRVELATERPFASAESEGFTRRDSNFVLAGWQQQTKPAPKKPKQQPPKGVNPMVNKFKATVGHTAPVEIKILPPKADIWKASKMTPLQLANKVESTMATMSHVSGSLETKMELAGGHGGGTGLVKIQDPHNFKVDFITPVLKPVPAAQLGFVVASNSKVAVVANDGKIQAARPISQIGSIGATDPAAWATHFGRDIFTACAGGKPLTNLVQMAQKKNSGLLVASEQKSFFARNTTITQQRLIITRTPAAQKKSGRLDIEVISDGHLNIPVTVRTSVEPPNKAAIRVFWTIRWNLNPGQVFEAKDFALPTTKVARKPVKSAKSAKA